MKVLIPILIGLLVVGCGKKESAKPSQEIDHSRSVDTHLPGGRNSDAAKDDWLGYFDSIKFSHFKLTEKFGEPVRDGGVLTVSRYDKMRNKVEEVTYDDNGQITNKVVITNKYDENGNRSGSEIILLDSAEEFRGVRRYGQQGNLLEELNYSGEYLLEKNIYKYDDKGNRVEWVGYDADGKAEFKATDKYDEKGNRTEEAGYDADGKVTYKHTYKYDGKRNDRPVRSNSDDRGQVGVVHYDAGGQITFEALFKHVYDKYGNILETMSYDTNGEIVVKSISKYDDKGNRIKKTIYVPKVGFSGTRFVPTDEYNWKFNYNLEGLNWEQQMLEKFYWKSKSKSLSDQAERIRTEQEKRYGVKTWHIVVLVLLSLILIEKIIDYVRSKSKGS